jgi:hypothetical protein
VKFVFNKSNAESVNDSVLLKFLYTLNYNMSPVCFLVQDKKVLGDTGLFINNRANTYPFLHEITSVFDINTAKVTDISQISFKNLYNEFKFYSDNSKYFGLVFGEFYKKYLFNTSEALLNHLVFTCIIYNNFFLNLKNVSGFFEKTAYSSYLNFAILYNFSKLYNSIKSSFYVNANFAGDASSVYLNFSKNLDIKKVSLNETTDLTIVSLKAYNNSLAAYEKYSSFFIKSNTSLVNMFKD